MHLLYLHCSGSASSDCTEGSGWSALVVFDDFLVFYFPLTQFPTIIYFFLNLVISSVAASLIIPELLLHFQCCSQSWVYHQLNIFKVTFYTSFQLPWVLSCCMWRPFINELNFTYQGLLISQRMLVKLFFRNRIIDISCNLSQYSQYKHV